MAGGETVQSFLPEEADSPPERWLNFALQLAAKNFALLNAPRRRQLIEMRLGRGNPSLLNLLTLRFRHGNERLNRFRVDAASPEPERFASVIRGAVRWPPRRTGRAVRRD
jgi:hypothetical protein